MIDSHTNLLFDWNTKNSSGENEDYNNNSNHNNIDNKNNYSFIDNNNNEINNINSYYNNESNQQLQNKDAYNDSSGSNYLSNNNNNNNNGELHINQHGLDLDQYQKQQQLQINQEEINNHYDSATEDDDDDEDYIEEEEEEDDEDEELEYGGYENQFNYFQEEDVEYVDQMFDQSDQSLYNHNNKQYTQLHHGSLQDNSQQPIDNIINYDDLNNSNSSQVNNYDNKQHLDIDEIISANAHTVYRTRSHFNLEYLNFEQLDEYFETKLPTENFDDSNNNFFGIFGDATSDEVYKKFILDLQNGALQRPSVDDHDEDDADYIPPEEEEEEEPEDEEYDENAINQNNSDTTGTNFEFQALLSDFIENEGNVQEFDANVKSLFDSVGKNQSKCSPSIPSLSPTKYNAGINNKSNTVLSVDAPSTGLETLDTEFPNFQMETNDNIFDDYRFDLSLTKHLSDSTLNSPQSPNPQLASNSTNNTTTIDGITSSLFNNNPIDPNNNNNNNYQDQDIEIDNTLNSNEYVHIELKTIQQFFQNNPQFLLNNNYDNNNNSNNNNNNENDNNSNIDDNNSINNENDNDNSNNFNYQSEQFKRKRLSNDNIQDNHKKHKSHTTTTAITSSSPQYEVFTEQSIARLKQQISNHYQLLLQVLLRIRIENYNFSNNNTKKKKLNKKSSKSQSSVIVGSGELGDDSQPPPPLHKQTEQCLKMLEELNTLYKIHCDKNLLSHFLLTQIESPTKFTRSAKRTMLPSFTSPIYNDECFKLHPYLEELLKEDPRPNESTMNVILNTFKDCFTDELKYRDANLLRLKFTPSEDKLLKLGLERYGPDWGKIRVNLLPSKTDEQIFHRYKNRIAANSADNIIKDFHSRSMLTKKEEDIFLNAVDEYGKDWDTIVSKCLPNKSAKMLADFYEKRVDSKKKRKKDKDKFKIKEIKEKDNDNDKEMEMETETEMEMENDLDDNKSSEIAISTSTTEMTTNTDKDKKKKSLPNLNINLLNDSALLEDSSPPQYHYLDRDITQPIIHSTKEDNSSCNSSPQDTMTLDQDNEESYGGHDGDVINHLDTCEDNVSLETNEKIDDIVNPIEDNVVTSSVNNNNNSSNSNNNTLPGTNMDTETHSAAITTTSRNECSDNKEVIEGIVVKWTREEDKIILITARERGNSNDVWEWTSENRLSNRTSSQISHRYLHLLELLKRNKQ